MSLIQISNLTFGYEGSYDNIFESVSLQIDTDWKLGLIGRNGRGKTTLLKLLMGKYSFQGSITASVGFEYFPFPVSGSEREAKAVVESIAPGQPDWRVVRELAMLELDQDVLDRSFSTLSPGERTKVLLAALFLKEHSFLLIDEPTNHLDQHARELVGRYLNRKTGFILVSHDRTFLDQCIDHVLSINKTNMEIQKGNFSSYQQNKAYQDSFEQAENDRLKKDIDRLRKSARRAAGWSEQIEKSKYGTGPVDRGYIGHQSAKMMKRAKAVEARRQRAAAEKSRLLRNVETAESLTLRPLPFHSELLCEATDLSVYFPSKTVCGPLSFAVRRGDRIALTGKNGAGKSSILKLLAGEELPHTGGLMIAKGLRISYLPQDPSSLSGSLSDFAREQEIDETRFKTILRKLDFSRTQFDKGLDAFSEGQKKKALLAASLCRPAHLYLWDEPLNFIDLLSRIQIEELILSAQPTMVFVEHDRAFTNAVATRTIPL